MSDLQPVIDDLHKRANEIRASADAIDADADALTGITPPPEPTPEPPNPTPGPISLGKYYGAFSMPLEQVQNVDGAFLDKQANALADLGVGWWRGDYPVSMVSPSKGQYNWTSVDGWVKRALDRGIKPLPICYMLPAWMNGGGNDKNPPLNDDDYATWCAEAAKHLASIGVTAMELWNEQNLDVFWTNQAATDDAYRGKYCRMMAKAYPAIKNVAPDMIVITGGLSTSDTVWNSKHQPDPPGCGALSTIKSYADKGLFYNCDAVGWHPYLDSDTACKDVGNWPSWSPKAVGAALGIIDAASRGGLSLWTTETGCPRSAVGNNQGEQAKRGEDAYKAYLPGGCLNQYAPRLGPFFWFCVADRRTGNSREDTFGFMNNNATSKYQIYDRMKTLWGQQWAGTVATWANVESGA